MVTWFWLVALLASATIFYRQELGGFSFLLVEPVVLGMVAWLIGAHLWRERRLVLLNEPLVWLGVVLLLWVGAIRPLSMDWQHGLSDVRDWLVPLLAFMVPVTYVRRGWRRLIVVFLVILWLNALFGIFQHFTDGYRPFAAAGAVYKQGFVVDPELAALEFVSYGTAFFEHPNGFGHYVILGIIIVLAWWLPQWYRVTRWEWWLGVFFLLPTSLALYWSYAKGSILVLAALAGLLVLHYLVRSTRWLLGLAGSGALLGALALIVIFPYIPAPYLETFWWRVELWEIALRFLESTPMIWLFGNGIDPFGMVAFYGQPHNLYLFLLLEYGLFGLLLLLGVGAVLLYQGVRAHQQGLMYREPLLMGVWLAIFSFYLLGMLETPLQALGGRMLFLLLLTFFVGLRRELRAAPPAPYPAPATPDQPHDHTLHDQQEKKARPHGGQAFAGADAH